MSRYVENAPEAIRRYWLRPRPIEFCPAYPEDYFNRQQLEPVQNVWVRTTGPSPTIVACAQPFWPICPT